MDVRDVLESSTLKEGDSIELMGWLVDRSDGLYVLGRHDPKEYEYPHRMKIVNGNIIYPILDKIPQLAGGWSLLFYKVRLRGTLVGHPPREIDASDISVSIDQGRNYKDIIIEPELIEQYVKLRGDYKFDWPRDPMRDWLKDAL